jgi:hypothetical protein
MVHRATTAVEPLESAQDLRVKPVALPSQLSDLLADHAHGKVIEIDGAELIDHRRQVAHAAKSRSRARRIGSSHVEAVRSVDTHHNKGGLWTRGNEDRFDSRRPVGRPEPALSSGL